MAVAQKAANQTGNKIVTVAARGKVSSKKPAEMREIKNGMKPTSEELRKLIAGHRGTLSLNDRPRVGYVLAGLQYG